ncbi:hypothetical protein WDU94_010779 [Cyamophila willieti]
MIETKISEIEDRNNEVVEGDEDGIEYPLDFEPIEARNAMADFRQANDSISSDEQDQMIGLLSAPTPSNESPKDDILFSLVEESHIVSRYPARTARGDTCLKVLYNLMKTMPLLPATLIQEGMAVINMEARDYTKLAETTDLREYMETYWLQTIGSEVLSVAEAPFRSNNAVEGFYSRVNKAIKTRRPRFGATMP